MSKLYKYTLSIALLALFLSSCVSSGDNTGIEFAPNMYVSQGYEPYAQEKKRDYNDHGMTMRLPVPGTVARGQLDYIYPNPNTVEGYEASASYSPAIAASKENVSEGERLYTIYCWHCHGKKGENDGAIFSSGKMPPPPWPGYTADYIKELPSGKIYHVIVRGKGLMGSHAHMLNPTQRWQVVHYVKYLSLGDEFRLVTKDTEVIQAIDSTSEEATINN